LVVLATTLSSTLLGVDAVPVAVEVDVSQGLPGYHVVGLAAQSVKEGAVRVRAALQAVGHDMPLSSVTVNLAPADLRKPGGGFDLPITVAVLSADYAGSSAAKEGSEPSGPSDAADAAAPVPQPTAAADAIPSGRKVSLEPLAGLIILGELGLDGSIRSVRGTLAAAMLARARGWRGVLVPRVNVHEAAMVEGIEVYCASHLAEVIDVMAGRAGLPVPDVRAARARRSGLLDLAEVRGQVMARPAPSLRSFRR
jgi:magnesium chelatase family protein